MMQLTGKQKYIKKKQYRAIVIGTSHGGMAALTRLLPVLPENYPIPFIIVQHVHPSQGGFLVEYYNERCSLTVKEADEKESICPGYVYFAPANYHLLIERNESFSLSVDDKVNYARPSIDVLFETAVDTYSSDLVGIILTGANNDGAHGLYQIKKNGGLTVVQDPETAESCYMPQAAIDVAEADCVMSLEEIGDLLIRLGESYWISCKRY
ncbi:MAG: chemotaxis protein CheB [Desulfobulbaceae bacterium]|nr:chemotaxis protein CheB [Desulfobulbaceae bacterium]